MSELELFQLLHRLCGTHSKLVLSLGNITTFCRNLKTHLFKLGSPEDFSAIEVFYILYIIIMVNILYNPKIVLKKSHICKSVRY